MAFATRTIGAASFAAVIVACGSSTGGQGGEEAGSTSEGGGVGATTDAAADQASPPADAGAAEGSASCPSLSPCGGDVVGTWTITGACVVSPAPIASCPQATESDSMQASGTVTFRADGTYAVDTMLGLTETIGLPASCLGGADCASLQMSLQGQSGVTSASCTASASAGCTCTEDFAPQPNSSTGTYAIAGASVTSPGAYAEPYCVQGSTIRWQDRNADGLLFLVTATK